MPGRQSHGAPSSKKPKVRVKSKKRALDAFSIASHQNPDKIKIRQHRLGAREGGNRPGKKRARDEDDEEDEEGELQSKKQRKGPAKGRFDELDVDEGSDSEGNNWKMGDVDSDDDSDLDSDEAFGESDEERFDGFAFGSSSDKKSKKKYSKPKDVNLDESEEESGSEMSDDSLGEDAIDLATMLDQMEEDSEEEEPRERRQPTEAGSDEEEGVVEPRGDMRLDEDESDSIEDNEEGDEKSEDESSISSADEDDTLDPTKLAAMHEMINSLPQTAESKRDSKRERPESGFEYKNPSRIGAAKTKLVFDDPAIPNNPKLKVKRAPKPLAVPISKRQQDRIDRTVAYDKTKETLDRWTDTVKHNRRAEHLMFPLPDNDVTSAHANTRLQPISQAKPFDELEATIQTILEESGLAAANGKDDEDRIREFEDLEANKMSIEEVKARRDQLRMARELLFREESKAKRIKKIKSKSYRKVHRKQREKEERQNREALAEGGFVPSEDELEAQDRRRAEERMGAKHRGSKWAKATKETGRAAWDEDARAGITEMARRDEELRKRIEGRTARNAGSDMSFSESDDEVSEEDDDDDSQRRILRQLHKVDKADSIDESAPGGKLANMKFMLKAEAARKKDNDAMVEDIRKELAGEEAPSEAEDGDVGRRTFGPGSNKVPEAPKASRNEFEEPNNSEDEADNSDVEIRRLDKATKGDVAAVRNKNVKGSARTFVLPPSLNRQLEAPSEGGAWSKVNSKSSMVTDAEARKRRQKKNNAVEVEELDLSQAAVIATQPNPKKSTKKDITTLDAGSEDDSDDENTVQVPFALRDQELIKRAFAGADVVGEFEAEKKQTIEDEDEKVVDNTLPGWGSWTGDGLSKREKARNKGKVLTKLEGIKEKNRKDAKLDRVIINQKRVKKNGKYLATSLPHPFETRQQYERSLRLPVGPEWATKETFQDATKPRILLKQGIVAPMSKPLL
ncbi:utp-14 domain containing [Hyphodiscus hymeniophilus]|uniref:Utp-14 domain containing n=1 Tax=Hyphodiscus hymeniophilus TaxID=353542 RepID=A0A9P7AX30_9HELO|nr:utp-14 domain containing [Hyphodiscus hymeniophilus]